MKLSRPGGCFYRSSYVFFLSLPFIQKQEETVFLVLDALVVVLFVTESPLISKCTSGMAGNSEIITSAYAKWSDHSERQESPHTDVLADKNAAPCTNGRNAKAAPQRCMERPKSG